MIMDPRRVGEQTRLRCIYSGAIQGVIAWTVYAIAECWFLSILPWMIKPNTYAPYHLGFTVILFVLYPLIGLIMGGLSGMCFYATIKRIQFFSKVQPEIYFPVVAAFTVVFAFTVNITYISPQLICILPSIVIFLILTLPLALSIRSSAWYKWLRFITNPWITSFVLIGPWIIVVLLFIYSMRVKAGSVLAYIVTILLFSFFVHRIIDRRQIVKSTKAVSMFPIRSLISLTLLVLVVIGINFFIKQVPIEDVSNLKPFALDSHRPNVILITMDTVRADHMSLYGYKRNTTPNLKEFAEKSVLYTNAIASGDMTLSSHASIFTGLYARQHGAHYDDPEYPGGRPLSDKFHTLAEILSEKGYLTMGVVANTGFLGPGFNLNQGFQYYDSRSPVNFFGSGGAYCLRRSIRNFLTLFSTPSQFDASYWNAEEINRETFKLLDKVKEEGERFFIFINYMDAHWPYMPPLPFDKQYPGKIETFTLSRYFELVEGILKLECKITKEEKLHLVSQYDGEIAYLDFYLGELFARLKKLGLYDNSLIIVTSDHGEVFGERQLMEHGVSVYQDLVHIPLIIKYPNTKNADVVNKPVSSIDLMPTILDVLGYEMQEDIQKNHLLKLNMQKPRSVLSETFPRSTHLRWHSRFDRIERAIFLGPYKFISSTAGKRELYDLSKDPNEKKNIYKIENKIAKKLEARLKQWLKDTKEESGTATKLDKDALDRLKALGYIQ